jgi:hypothetical protein
MRLRSRCVDSPVRNTKQGLVKVPGQQYMEADRNVANSTLDLFVLLIQSRGLRHDGVYTGFERYKFWLSALRLEFDIVEMQL